MSAITPYIRRIPWQHGIAWLIGVIAVVNIVFVNIFSLDQMRSFFWFNIFLVVHICNLIVAINTSKREKIYLRKIAWNFIGLASLLHIIYSVTRRFIDYRTDIFFVGVFICTILSLALYFPKNIWSIGNIWRVIFDVFLLAFSSIALMQSFIYYFFGKTSQSVLASAYVVWIGFEIADFVQTLFLWQRYRQRILGLVVLAAICVILADVTGTVRIWFVEIQPLFGLPDNSLYYIQLMIIMIFGYYSVDNIKDIDFDKKNPVSLFDWTTQLLTPKMFFIASFLVVCLVHLPDRWVIVAMAIAALFQSIAAITEEGKLVQRLFAAMDSANEANAHLNASNQRLVRMQHQLHLLLQQIEGLTLTQERARIARDIHDGVGQRLLAVQLIVNELQDRLDAQYTIVMQKLVQNIDGVQQTIRQAITALRDTRELSLEDSLAEPLELSRPLGLQASLEVRGVPRRVSASIRHMLYHIAMEAITNASQHGGAEHIQLIADYTDPHSVSLSIVDDGCGFLDHPPQPGHGNGLPNMRDRAEALGGECHVTSSEQGVTVWARIPTESAP